MPHPISTNSNAVKTALEVSLALFEGERDGLGAGRADLSALAGRTPPLEMAPQ
jgi:hypothetical protein